MSTADVAIVAMKKKIIALPYSVVTGQGYINHTRLNHTLTPTYEQKYSGLMPTL